MGVRRAVETTMDMVRANEEEIATFGPLIHNPQVLDILRERGVKILDNIPDHSAGTIIIRAHGIPPKQKEKLLSIGAKIEDATCPRVVKVQAIISRYKKEGCATVIIGDRNHAEVEGLMGYAEPHGVVVSNDNDLENLQISSPYIIVSQTTQDDASFERLSEMIMARFPGGRVFNTICDSTHKRQEAVLELCGMVQAMVVVGGKSSANTKRLGEIVENKGCPVFMVETEEDLDMKALAHFDCVGVTAGASTPAWMIDRVIRTLESIPGRGQSVVGTMAYRFLCFLLASNLLVSLGGGALVYVCSRLQGTSLSLDHLFIVFGYLFAMHNFNRFTSRWHKKGSDPVREVFNKKYRWPLLIASSIFLVVALGLSYRINWQTFLLLALISVLGGMYNVRFIPGFVSAVIRVRKLKEIPGSKTLFVAMAWAFVIVLVPLWADRSYLPPQALGTFLFVLLLVFVRNALSDVFEVQSDQMVGKETLPVCIGKKRTLTLLYAIMLFLALMLLFFPLCGFMSKTGFWLLPGIVYLALVAVLYERKMLLHGTKLAFGLDAIFFVLAVLARIGDYGGYYL